MSPPDVATARFALAVTWEARDGEADAVADILRRLVAAVETEPGVLLFLAHRAPDAPHRFFLYELYADEAAFVAHQETEHFKTLVLGEALPRLARRERTACLPFAAFAR